MWRGVLYSVVTVSLLSSCSNHAAQQHDPAVDKAAIEAVLQGFPRDFNAKNFDPLCAVFEEDAVLHYPEGGPDQGRGVFCARMRKLLSDPDRQYSYSEPEIREVIVEGDLATVALYWTLTVKDRDGKVLDTIREDGLDVFRRQADGSWKLHISHAFAMN
jgi:ketosteroid isomerase-like protein